MQMTKRLMTVLATFALLLPVAPAWADEYQDTINMFKNAVQSKGFFGNAYGYAVFPTIGKAGFIVGGAAGKGRVYEKGKYVGDTSVAQLSVGYQAGAEGYSQIIFFEDQRAFKEFTSGNFEFDANASATAITGERRRDGLDDGRLGAGQRRQERRQGGGQVLQGHGHLHRRQGWPDGGCRGRRPEVLVHAGGREAQEVRLRGVLPRSRDRDGERCPSRSRPVPQAARSASLAAARGTTLPSVRPLHRYGRADASLRALRMPLTRGLTASLAVRGGANAAPLARPAGSRATSGCPG